MKRDDSSSFSFSAPAQRKRASALPTRRTLLLASAFLLSAGVPTRAADILPTNGTVVAGAGAISQSGSQMTVHQSSDKMAVDWQSFSIGPNNGVTFVQPSASAVALNRVLGSDVSVIQGALTANGHIFLINPNGVLFTPTAQVNTGSLVASTLAIKTEDFMAGTYKFEGASSNAIINQGNITAAPGGTIALIAAKITNEGNLTAPSGNVLLGAGGAVTLDMGGPVKIQVDKAVLNALINQGGAIKANDGLVYLTAKAAGDLATTVINHTGVTEAQRLTANGRGEIVLLGDADNDQINVGGTLDASAPNGGNGGFIETSAATVKVADDVHVTTAAPFGTTGTWLIDPTNITIGASSCTGTNCLSAATIATNLGSTNVSIATDAAGTDAGNITVNAPVSWAANKLTLAAHNNININATLTASGTGSLAFLYGLGSTDGGSSTYTVASGAKIYIPSADNFTWQKGSASAIKNLTFNNDLLRFGNGTESSINSDGQLKQPFYFDNTSVIDGTQRNAWYQLTFSNYPLDIQVASGGDGTNSWNLNGDVLTTNNAANQNSYSSQVSSRSLEISGYKEGSGTIVASENLTFGSDAVIKVQNTYSLGAHDAYLKTDTTLTNMGASDVSNVRLWVGTRDDYIGEADQSYKFKGNLTADGFVQITDPTTQAKALKISELNSDQGAVVLFYSTSAGANTSIDRCCRFTNATNLDPQTSPIFRGNTGGVPSEEDGSYALFMRLSDLAPGASDGMTWYYAAASAQLISTVVTDVSTSAGVTPPTPPPPPAPPAPTPEPAPVVVIPPETTPPVVAAIQTAQTVASAGQNTNITNSTTTTSAPAAQALYVPLPPTTMPNLTAPTQSGHVSGNLQLVALPAPASGGSDSSTPDNNDQGAGPEGGATLQMGGGASGPGGLLNVFVVGGGVHMPDGNDELH